MQDTAKLAGFNPPNSDYDPGQKKPMATVWMTDALIDETIEVWTKFYDRVICRDEAVEILRNVKNLYELVSTIVE